MRCLRLSVSAILSAAFVITLAGRSFSQAIPTPGGVNTVQDTTSGSITIDPAGTGATVDASFGSFTPGGVGSGGGAGGGSNSGGGGAGGGSVSNCVWTADPSQTPGTQTGGFDSSGNYVQPGVPGQWYLVSCNGEIGQAQFVAQGPPQPAGQPAAPSPPSPQQLMLDARSHLSLPGPVVQLSPPADQWQYVQMPTWAWLASGAWEPLTASASAGPVTVTVTATPLRLEFSYQTSAATTASTTCTGPGTPYSDGLATAEDPQLPVQAASPDCGWTWHESSVDTPDQKYGITAHVVYHLAWTVSGAAGGGDLGELTGPDTTFRVSVGEIQALNTTGR